MIIVLAMLIVSSSCVSRKKSNYKSWAARPTPGIFKINNPWIFIELEEKDQIARCFTVTFTDEPATNCCIAGNWLKLAISDPKPPRILSEHVVAFTVRGDGLEPAYLLEGSALWIVFTANICDVEDAFIGEIVEQGFIGYARHGGMFGSTDLGPVYGAPVHGRETTTLD